MPQNIQCILRGKVSLANEAPVGLVFSDTAGNVWLTDEAHQRLYYLDRRTIDETVAQQLSPLLNTPTPPEPHLLADIADIVDDATDLGAAPEGDAFFSVLFFYHHEQVSACAVSTGGALFFFSGGGDATPQLLRAIYLARHITAAVVLDSTFHTPSTLFLCSVSDGAEHEVLSISVQPAASATCSSSSSARLPSGIDIEGMGLFQVSAAVSTLLCDSMEGLLFAITTAGVVQIWHWPTAQDVTHRYFPLSWNALADGAPTCGLFVKGALWIGLDSGWLVVLPLRCCTAELHGERDGEEPAVLRLRSHPSSIAGLLPISLGGRVWSYGSTGSKVNVWDTSSGSLNGSFYFPGDGVASLRSGGQQLQSRLYGCDVTTGAVEVLDVSDAHAMDAAQVMSPAEVIDGRRRVALLGAAAAVLSFIEAATVSSAEAGSNSNDGQAVPLSISASVDALVDCGICTPQLHRVLHDLMDALECHQLIKRSGCCSAAGEMEDDDDDSPAGLKATVQAMLQVWREQQNVLASVELFIESVNILRASRPLLTTLDEVEREVAQWRSRLVALEEKRTGVADDFSQMTTSEQYHSMKQLQREVDELKGALQEEVARGEALQEQNRTLSAELDASCAREQHTESLLRETEELVEQLKKSVLASKRAAEVTVSDATSLFEMEAKLNTTQQSLIDAHAQLERAVQEATVARKDLAEYCDAVSVFELKEQAAKQVLSDVLQYQNGIVDDVQLAIDDLYAMLDQLNEEDASLIHDVHSSPPGNLFVSEMNNRLARLDARIEERLSQQKAVFQRIAEELSR